MSASNDEMAQGEEANFRSTERKQRQQLRNELLSHLSAIGRNAHQDAGLRKLYSARIFCLVITWLCMVAVLVFLSGVHRSWVVALEIKESVLLALVSSVTLNIVGLLGTVIAYLFAKKNQEEALIDALIKGITLPDGETYAPTHKREPVEVAGANDPNIEQDVNDTGARP